MILDFNNSIAEVHQIQSLAIIDNDNVSQTFCVGIPTYKRADTLEKTLESVLRQKKCVNFNILISDNNPERDDETELLMRQYKDVKGLKYFKHVLPLTPADNFNKLLDLCNTKYLFIVHDDDELFPEFVDYMVKILHIYPTLSYAKCNKISWNGVCKPLQGKQVTKNALFKVSLFSLFYQFGLAPTGCCISVSDAKDVGGFSKSALPATDYVFVAQLLMKRKLVLYTTKKLMYYRCVANDTSNPLTQEKLKYMDTQIKSELGKILNLPKTYIKLIVKMTEKTHDIAISRILTGEKNTLQKCFFLCARIVDILHKVYFYMTLKVKSI